MNDFFSSIKADLLDRRIRPIAAIAVIALLGAGAYVVLGGGSGSSSSTSAAVPVRVPSSVTTASLTTSTTVPNTASAETTEGEGEQHHGVAHNPFASLPQAKAPAAPAPAATTASSAASSSSSSASSESKASETTGTTEASKPAPAKAKTTIYHVAVLFGLTPPPPPAPSAPLTPYENLKLLAALPSAKSPLVVYRGVTSGGKSATFTLVSEAILHGQGTCLPNASQCAAIDLKPGQTEQLEYIGSEGQIISYELSVVSIAAQKASSAAAASMLGHRSKAGRELLRNAGLVAIPGLHVSSQAGVLVFADRAAFSARAHASRRAHAGH